MNEGAFSLNEGAFSLNEGAFSHWQIQMARELLGVMNAWFRIDAATIRARILIGFGILPARMPMMPLEEYVFIPRFDPARLRVQL